MASNDLSKSILDVFVALDITCVTIRHNLPFDCYELTFDDWTGVERCFDFFARESDGKQEIRAALETLEADILNLREYLGLTKIEGGEKVNWG